MPKGKYYGPDKYKGIRPTGKDKYYGPNKYKGVAPTKKKSTLLTQAEKLGKSKYAPVLKELEMNENTNTSMYNSATDQRRGAVDREIGSIAAAGATAGRQIGDLGTSNASMYQKTIADSQANTSNLVDKLNTNNTNMLSALQANMKARGVENYSDYSNLVGQDAKKMELMTAMSNLQTHALEGQSGLADQRFKALQANSKMLDTTAQSNARGAAQANMDELYTKWLEKQQELDTAQAKTKLEQGDYTNQTYLTLKEKAAQAKAEKAQAALQASIAQGNLDFKNLNLQVKTQTEYDKMSAKAKQQSIENTLKSKGFSHKKAIDLAAIAIKSGNLKLSQDKFDWSKANPKKSVAINWNDLLAAGN